ncbi:hypothetical protein EDD86DRAFT_246496 [Gorgonomyces haynaldii]|nr:hypothetical protein EDD86DRAFT_246496 [Gorgonomyces haynaldii]
MFSEDAFRYKVGKAIEQVSKILDLERQPEICTLVQHEYDDKYLLSEFIVNMSLASALIALEQLGLPTLDWKESITLRFEATEHCTFVMKQTRKEQSKTANIVDLGVHKIKNYVETTVEEYIWTKECKWELSCYPGTDLSKKKILISRSGTTSVKTLSNNEPRPANYVVPPVEVQIDYLLKNSGQIQFSINRNDPKCHTPRRNKQVIEALGFLAKLTQFASSVRDYFIHTVFQMPEPRPDISGLDQESDIFLPIFAVFEKNEQKQRVYIEDAPKFLSHETKTIESRFANLQKMYPLQEGVLTFKEVQVVEMLRLLTEIQDLADFNLDGVEAMIQQQVIAAIGKYVRPSDIDEYLAFHNSRYFAPAYQPLAFNFAVRRPEHVPEGILSIETPSKDANVPIQTYCSQQEAEFYMNLDASTQVHLKGKRYVHGFLKTAFSDSDPTSLELVCRARAYSCFVVCMGRISGPKQFEPKHAILVKNKDRFLIPLLTETIPSAKEFKDAISSLSPEQQQFAKQFRQMQLSTSLFGLLVVQVKPQLEKVLNLPPDALTKEIQLTQELMHLFTEFQIPSDLLSFDPAILDDWHVEKQITVNEKLKMVKKNVEQVNLVIAEERKRELEEAENKSKLRKAEEAVKTNPTMNIYFGAAPTPTPQFPVMAPGAPMLMASAPAPMARAKKAGGVFRSLSKSLSRTVMDTEAPKPVPPPKIQKEQAADVTEPQSEPSGNNRESQNADVGGLTSLPLTLDQNFEKYDKEGAVRPTVLSIGPSWEKKFTKSSLSKEESQTLDDDEQTTEKNKALDLLDALTKSGALTIEEAEFHVILAVTHVFDKTVMELVVQGNVNPISKIEKSSLVLASTIHGQPFQELTASVPKELE